MAVAPPLSPEMILIGPVILSYGCGSEPFKMDLREFRLVKVNTCCTADGGNSHAGVTV